LKHVIVLGDGMADYPIEALGHQTPLMYAHKPNMDFMAQYGTQGTVKTVPDSLLPGSDVANLSVLGYDPVTHYTGRSPLEAMSIGISMKETDLAIRCNLVTLSDEETYSHKTLIDYCADEISTDEAKELIAFLNDTMPPSSLKLYAGKSYRHCAIWDHGSSEIHTTPPHDIIGQKIQTYLPRESPSAILLQRMRDAHKLLADHPINLQRIQKGLLPANGIWFWGEGKKPILPPFTEVHGKKGSMISAVDLLNGIAICSGLDVIQVAGATGNLHTNYLGKAKAALEALESGQDFVYLHVEAPDECGHRGEMENKITSIERIDTLLGFLLQNLRHREDFKIMVLPDHYTPLSLRTHTRDPVPFVSYQKSKHAPSGLKTYDESTARKTGIHIEPGHALIQKFFHA
jgi:2,3-bisphosphoglycerate-independent phosphoglycerate mutase